MQREAAKRRPTRPKSLVRGSSAECCELPNSPRKEPLPVTTEHCTDRCTEARHSSTCRSRMRRTRVNGARREQADQNVPAYLSDELGLSEEEKVGVELIARTRIKDEQGNVTGHLGAATMEQLLRCIDRGTRDGVIESAWALPLWQFRKVEEAWRAA